MPISPKNGPLGCLFVFALMTSATAPAIAQSSRDAPSMLGGTARQMLSAQDIYRPDFVVRAPYVGIGVGRSSLEPDISQLPDLELTEGDQVGVQLTVGMDFGEWLSAEFHVADLGKAEFSDDSSVAYQEIGVSTLLYLGNNRDRFNRRGWNVFGRAGLGYLENGVSEGAGYEQKEAGQWILGAGAEYSTARGFGVRAEAMVYDSDVSYFQLGLMYRFAKIPGGLSGIGDLGVSSVDRAEIARLEAARAEIASADAAREAAARAERAQVEIANVESTQAALDRAKQERAQAALAQAELDKAERARAALAKAELSQAERTQAALAQAELDKAERARAALAKAELSQAERAQAALAQAERDKADRARTALAQAEQKQADSARAALAQAELQRAEAARLELARAEQAALAQAQIARANTARAAARAQANSTLATPSTSSRQIVQVSGSCATATGRGQNCVVLDGVIEGLKFQPGSNELTSSARGILNRVAASLLQVPQMKARLNTHTDGDGMEESNMRLSEQRALAIARYLVRQGVPKTMLEARAFGERRPIDTNETAAGRFKNGRVEIFLIPQ